MSHPFDETPDSLWSRVDVRGDGECWPFLGRSRKYDGRGYVEWYGRCHSAPRLVWALHARVMPPAHLFVCHTCNNAKCCNPAHLYLGTRSDNVRDSVLAGTHKWASKQQCPKGHDYSEENTYVEQRPDGGMRRHCRICRSDWQKAFKMRKAA